LVSVKIICFSGVGGEGQASTALRQ
jgi:hypothetical protein